MEVQLPYKPLCAPVCWLVGLCFIISLKDVRQLHFHAPVGPRTESLLCKSHHLLLSTIALIVFEDVVLSGHGIG